MDWSNERVEELRRLWGQGQTASRIAELLGGVTRNAVIGKAHRLGLRGRPSPIRRDENAPFVRMSRPSQPAQAAGEPAAEQAPQPVAETPAPVQAQPTVQAKAPQSGGRSCSWPVGDPKQHVGFQSRDAAGLFGVNRCLPKGLHLRVEGVNKVIVDLHDTRHRQIFPLRHVSAIAARAYCPRSTGRAFRIFPLPYLALHSTILCRVRIRD